MAERWELDCEYRVEKVDGDKVLAFCRFFVEKGLGFQECKKDNFIEGQSTDQFMDFFNAMH
jgi:hypothetical protein